MLQDRRNKFFVLFASEILICIIVGLAMAFVMPAHNFPLQLDVLKQTGYTLLSLSFIQIFTYLVYWFFYHMLMSI